MKCHAYIQSHRNQFLLINTIKIKILTICDPSALRRKYHFDEIFFTDCTGSWHIDN